MERWGDGRFMNWPDKPTCHYVAPVFKVSDIVWRPERPEGYPEHSQNPYGYPFRTCSYCGSIHPEDLLRVLANGATLGGSDWKYGWPHKFYVEGIPNPLAGKMVEQYSYTSRPDLYPEETWEKDPEGEGYRNKKESWVAPATTHAKWYNTHLLDLDDKAFAFMAESLKMYAGIEFKKVDGELKYCAPYAGYQK